MGHRDTPPAPALAPNRRALAVVGTLIMPNALLADLRAAVAALRHAPGFAAVAILTLGGGVALCVLLLTIANAYVLAPLPYPAADRLYSVRYAAPGQDGPARMEDLAWDSLLDVLEERLAWDLDVFYLRGDPHPERAPGAWVTPGFMAGFGMRPAIGRGFEPADFQAGRPQVALISHRLWTTRFGATPAIVGRQVQAYVSDRPDEAETFTIVGVLPRDLWHFNLYTEVLAPLRAPSYPYIVRLRPGVAPGLAAERITRLVRAGGAALPPAWHAELTPTQESYTRPVRPVLRAVGVAAGLVLLMACANVAVVQLLRARKREREMAVRLALGASLSRLARLVVLEALVVGLAATLLGLAVSRSVIQPIVPLVERQLGRPVPGGQEAVRFDATVLAGAAACGVLTTCLFALAPLVVNRRTSAAAALAASGRTATESAGPRRARATLIAIELAASLALLSGSMLMIDSVRRMIAVDLGFRAHRVYTAGIGLRQRSYPDAASLAAFYERALPRLHETRGISDLSAVDWWPLQPAHPRRLLAEGAPSGATTRAGVVSITGGYFETLQIPVRQGRTFTPRDRLGAEPVAIISETLARRLWNGAPAVGRRVRVSGEPDGDAPGAPPPEVSCTVVGVVGDVRQGASDDDLGELYRPLLQEPGRFAFLQLRVLDPASGWESAFRRTLVAVDPDLPLGAVQRLDEAVDAERARPWFLASLLAAFAVPAGLLALMGVYGTIAYGTRQREREIAVRMALGAERRSIVALFVREGGAMLAAGLALGVAGALAMGRLLQSELFAVRPGDPGLLALTAGILAIAGLAAVWWPARRAALTDPAAALRRE